LTLINKFRSVNEIDAAYETTENRQVNAKSPLKPRLLAVSEVCLAQHRNSRLHAQNQVIMKSGDAGRSIRF